MDNKLYVGNFSYSLTEEALRALFAEFGEIEEVVIIKDRYTKQSKGFGFVTFKNAADAKKAIEALNEKEVDGRKLVVNVARPKKEFGERRDFGVRKSF